MDNRASSSCVARPPIYNMLRTILCALGLTVAANLALAAPDAKRCEALDATAQQGAGFHPPLSARVVGKGRAALYLAPDEACKDTKFLIPRDLVTVYTPHDGWMYVMFVHPKTGEDTSAWIREDRLKTTGTIGPAKP